MGCVQTKPPGDSSLGIERLKLQSGYVAIRRRSTSQRNLSDDHGGRPPPRPESRSQSGGSSGSGGKGGSSGGRRIAGGNSGDVNARGERVRSSGSGSGDGNAPRRHSSSSKNNSFEDEAMVDGWPRWLVDNVPGHVLKGLVPKSADSYDKIDKVGQGTYSNVYKARDRDTGKLVALKKVKFDTSEPESVKFMAREIMILRELDHPNVLTLEGLATSRMQYSLYLVFDYMQSDLQRIICRPEGPLTEPQIKCYMQQLLSGLQHCHEKGILHRDIKGSNLLIDKSGMLKIADFGLSNYYKPRDKHPLTNRVVTLWYRAPELLLGSTDYGIGIDLWSAGCLLAEMFAGHPILPGRTEVEQLHRIFKLCGTPSDDYWKKLKLNKTFRPKQSYRSSLVESFRAFPDTSVGLLSSLLALDPAYRGTASVALENEFFYTSPLACDLSGLPVIYKEEDEIIPTNDRKSRRRSRTRRQARSNSQSEHRRKDTGTENPAEGADMAKEEKEKQATTNAIIQNQEPASLTRSNTTGSKLQVQEETPPILLTRYEPLNYRSSSRLPSTPILSNNTNLPPLPVNKPRTMKYSNDDSMCRPNHPPITRSASTREFRKLNPRKQLDRYAVED